MLSKRENSSPVCYTGITGRRVENGLPDRMCGVLHCHLDFDAHTWDAWGQACWCSLCSIGQYAALPPVRQAGAACCLLWSSTLSGDVRQFRCGGICLPRMARSGHLSGILLFDPFLFIEMMPLKKLLESEYSVRIYDRLCRMIGSCNECNESVSGYMTDRRSRAQDATAAIPTRHWLVRQCSACGFQALAEACHKLIQEMGGHT